MKIKIDLLVYNSSKLLTLTCGGRPLAGKEMQNLGSIEKGAVAINEGLIVECGTSESILHKYDAVILIDAENSLVMPGFVDCHTHLVFAGTREHELEIKLSGAKYIDILKAGGGIHSTVNATRNMSADELYSVSLDYMNRMIRHGTTAFEIKSGYGLNHETEKKILQTIQRLKNGSECEIASTFLGAHVVPKETSRDEYIKWLLQALPLFSSTAEFCDIFTEEGAYTLDETVKILSEAKRYGYKLKIHAGQFNDLKAAGAASELSAISADHLEKISDDELNILKKNKTVCVLMPGVNFFLMADDYADARRMIDNGNIVAISTDFNPGSCPCFSMQMIIALACYKLKMLPEEAICASTINAAYAMGRENSIGSLEPGKRADIIIMNVSEPAHIPYFFGTNLVKKIILKGKLLKD